MYMDHFIDRCTTRHDALDLALVLTLVSGVVASMVATAG